MPTKYIIKKDLSLEYGGTSFETADNPEAAAFFVKLALLEGCVKVTVEDAENYKE